HAVGDDLEVAVTMTAKDVPDVLVHEGLAAQKRVIISALLLAAVNQGIQVLARQIVRGSFFLHPAAVATKVTGLGEGNEHEGRVRLAIVHGAFVGPDRLGSLVDPKVARLESQSGLDLACHSCRQLY